MRSARLPGRPRRQNARQPCANEACAMGKVLAAALTFEGQHLRWASLSTSSAGSWRRADTGRTQRFRTKGFAHGCVRSSGRKRSDSTGCTRDPVLLFFALPVSLQDRNRNFSCNRQAHCKTVMGTLRGYTTRKVRTGVSYARNGVATFTACVRVIQSKCASDTLSGGAGGHTLCRD